MDRLALDVVRRTMAAELRATGDTEAAAALRGSMWALRKNPENLTGGQRTTLAAIQATNETLYRAYLLKERLRAVFAVGSNHRCALLAGWLAWACRSRSSAFVKLAKTISRYKPLILNAIDHGLSNARSEATNTHLRALTKRANGSTAPTPSSPWPPSPAATCTHHAETITKPPTDLV